nr:MAG TPA: hypothetical protein [Caudoviricetes sp.]
MTVRRSTGYTLVLACYLGVLTILAASAWLNDDRLAWAGLILFTVLCMVSAVLVTLNEH